MVDSPRLARVGLVGGTTGLLASSANLDWQGPTEYIEVTGQVDHVVVENAVELRHYAHASQPIASAVPSAPVPVWRPNFTPIGEVNQTFALLGCVAECLLSGGVPEVTILGGYEAMRLCKAVYDSHGDRVKVASIA